MTVDTATPRSRRAILAASLGGAAALVANALGRPLPAEAANGDTMHVGGEYTSTAVTYIENSASGDPGIAFWGASPASVGVYGSSSATSGVVGEGPEGVHGYGGTIGVQGEAASGDGVVGKGSNGVHGIGDSVGVYGESAGVSGWGVLGSGTNIGVRGQSGNGIGVQGLSSNAPGVLGKSASGPGVEGENESGGTGVMGSSGIIEDEDFAVPPMTGVYGISQ